MAQSPYSPPVPSDDKGTAVLAHLGCFFMPVVLPALLYLTSERKPFVRKVAAHAAVFQGLTFGGLVLAPITSTIVTVILVTSMERREAETFVHLIPVIGYLVAVVLFVLAVIGSIVGALRANEQKVWRVPLLGGLVDRIAGA